MYNAHFLFDNRTSESFGSLKTIKGVTIRNRPCNQGIRKSLKAQSTSTEHIKKTPTKTVWSYDQKAKDKLRRHYIQSKILTERLKREPIKR